MIRRCLPPLLCAAVLTLTGCGTTYHLKGHKAANVHAPPNINMRTGEKRLAVSLGLEYGLLNTMIPPLQSDDPGVVEIVGEPRSVWLLARKPGIARLAYNWQSHKTPPNEAFLVWVTDR